ncbi:MAG TPA: hypothetical protein VGI39_04210 [Polyangiaceae bacterium]
MCPRRPLRPPLIKYPRTSLSWTLASPTSYYDILTELVRLKRSDLAVFKSRFMWAWDRCGGERTLPSRFATGATGCGFVFVPVSGEDESQAIVALRNFTSAAKYDLRVDRCVGIAFRRDTGGYRLVYWAHEVHQWEPDPDWERELKSCYPFRELQGVVAPTYRFDG